MIAEPNQGNSMIKIVILNGAVFVVVNDYNVIARVMIEHLLVGQGFGQGNLNLRH
jgi:hypothetical protein